MPEVRVTTTLLPVVAAEADAMEEATELALAELKELCTLKLQRVSTSRTSLSFTLSSSSSSVSVSYCATQASQLGIRVEALAALQMHWSSALSLSVLCFSCDLQREKLVSTMLVVAVTRDSYDLSTDLGALLGDVVLADVLSRNESGQGCGNGELLEEHCEGLLIVLSRKIGYRDEVLIEEVMYCSVVKMHLGPWMQLPYILTPKPVINERPKLSPSASNTDLSVNLAAEMLRHSRPNCDAWTRR